MIFVGRRQWLGAFIALAACGDHTLAPSDSKAPSAGARDAAVEATQRATAGTSASRLGVMSGAAGSQMMTTNNGVPDAAIGVNAPDSGPAASTQSSKQFRVTELDLRDPHLFLGPGDITDSVNVDLVKTRLNSDGDLDGFLDVSILLSITPFGVDAASGTLHAVSAQCQAANPAHCEPDPNGALDAEWTISNQTSGTCLDVLPDTTGGYMPPPSAALAPCFATNEARDLMFTFGGVSIPMTAARMAASYAKPNEIDGLIEGYVTRSQAQTAVLPSWLPLVGNAPIIHFLHDADADDAASPNGESGFWFYLNFVAQPI